MSDLLLRIKNAQGDLQRVPQSDENFLAYQAGLQLKSSGGTSVGDIQLSSANARGIGSLSNTFYNEAIGTHPESNLTIGTTTTQLYQKYGNATEQSDTQKVTGLNRYKWQMPVKYATVNDKTGVHPITNTEMNNLCDRLNSIIATNDYPGAYYLDSANGMNGDWAKKFKIQSDTRADGDSAEHWIWQRQTMTAPTPTVHLAYVLDSDGFQGIHQMTNTIERYTLGQRCKTRRAVEGNIGNYEIRSATAGAPTATGTWVAKGTVEDTRHITGEVAYGRVRTSNYTRERDSTYQRTDIENFSRLFAGDYTGNYSRTFEGNYLRTRNSNYQRQRDVVYAGDYVGNYSRAFIGDYQRDFFRHFEGNYTGNYLRLKLENYTGNYNRDITDTYIRLRNVDYTGNYSREIQDNYEGNYTPIYTRLRQSAFQRNRISTSYAKLQDTYTRLRESIYTGDYTGNYSRDFAGNYTGDYSRIRISNYNRQRFSTYARLAVDSYTGTYTGNYTRAFVGNYARRFIGDYNRYFQRTDVGNYVQDYNRISIRSSIWYIRQRVSNKSYTRIAETFSTRAFIGPMVYSDPRTYGNVYTRRIASVGQNNVYYLGPPIEYSRGYLGDQSTYMVSYSGPPGPLYYLGVQYYVGDIAYSGNFEGYYSRAYIGNYTGDFAVAYQRLTNSNYARTRYSTYQRLQSITSTRERATTSTRLFAGDYARDFIGEYQRTSTITRTSTYQRLRSQPFARTFAGNYTRMRNTTYGRDYLGNYTGDYIGNYTRTLVSVYSRMRTSTYLRLSVGDYTGNYTRKRSSTYQRLRPSSFEGNYIRVSVREREEFRTSTYTRNRTSTYLRNDIENYTGDYTGDYTRDFIGDYNRDRVSTYLRLSLRDRYSAYTGEYVGEYFRVFGANFTRTFQGDYTGTTLVSSFTTNESYTLYVRTA